MTSFWIDAGLTAHGSHARVTMTMSTPTERSHLRKEPSMAVMRWLDRALGNDDGQGLAEYALILALIAVIAIAALVFLGTQISGILSTIGANI
jgi:pilus assembly protein Flp/PilA